MVGNVAARSTGAIERREKERRRGEIRRREGRNFGNNGIVDKVIERKLWKEIPEAKSDEARRTSRGELMGKKKRRRQRRRPAVVPSRFKDSFSFSPVLLLLPLSFTPELTVSILRLLCSHLILIPGLLRSASVAGVAVYFNGNPFTIGDRCCRARGAADVSRASYRKSSVKTGPTRRMATDGVRAPRGTGGG